MPKTDLTSRELFYLMALTRVPRLGSIGIRKILPHFPRIEDIFLADYEELAPLTSGAVAENIVRFKDFDLVEKEMEYAQRNDIQIVHMFHPAYPFRLKHTPDGPVVLFVKGRLPSGPRACVAVVGTRKITPYGQKFVEKLVSGLKAYDPVIVSGLAYGVDIEAHRRALENELVTIAVMGTSFEKIYPAVHSREYRMILDAGGAVISETWTSELTDPNFFLRRNRIVAGMVEAVVVVESAAKGGALTTAEMAFSYNRDVFAVPGRTTDTYSEGCNRLIASERARILLDAETLAQNLNWHTRQRNPEPVQTQLFTNLSEDEHRIYAHLLQNGPQHVDLLAVELNMPVSQISQMLLMMELKGVISALPGNKYEAI